MKKIITLLLTALCLLTSNAFADGVQTSGGVKPKRDSFQAEQFKNQLPTQVYVRIKSIHLENNINNVGYYEALVSSQKSTVNEIKRYEQELSPEVVEALQKSIKSNDWVPLNK
ncbi:hypothetical protein [Bdellovibrio sp. BCCA]|uniref:hypothetical protein n=1 Tax=Bdellovibrio sp. BCCA TaxID=3136281 RepID=UPI0030F32493